MKTYKLLKPLPLCPVGRLFKETFDGSDYYHYMTDEEGIGQTLIMYRFSKGHVESSPDFFEEVQPVTDNDNQKMELRRRIRANQRKVNFHNNRILILEKELEDLEDNKTITFTVKNSGYVPRSINIFGGLKIKGYKCPMDLCDGKVKKGTLFINYPINIELYVPSDPTISIVQYYSVPKELVEKWEVVYE